MQDGTTDEEMPVRSTERSGSGKTGRPPVNLRPSGATAPGREGDRPQQDWEERFEDLFEHACEAILLTDLGGAITHVNHLVEEYGFRREDLIGRHLFDFVVADHQAQARADFAVLLGGTAVKGEMDVLTPQGVFSVEYRDSPIRRSGRIVGVQVILTDITQRKRAETAYRSLVDHSLQGLVIFQDGKAVFTNQAMAEITGYTVDEILASSPAQIRDFVHPDDRAAVWENHRRRLAGALLPGHYELRGIRKDGTLRWLDLYASRIDYRGRPAIQAAYVDITERKQAEETLRLREGQYRGIFENAVLGLYRTTPEGKILAANPALVRMMGYDTFEELATRNLEQEGFAPEYPRAQFKQRMAAEGRIVGLESAWKRRDGTTLWVRESAKAVRDAAGKILCYEGTVEDITERKHTDRLMRTLATAAMELVELPPEADLFRFVGDKVLALIGAGIVSVHSIDGDTLTIRHVAGAQTALLKLAQKMLGKAVRGMTLPGVHEVARSALLTGQLTRVEGGLYELFFRAVPRPVCWTLEQALGLKECYSIGLRRPNRLLGSVTILTQKRTQLNAEVIEAFVNQVSIALERRQAQQALRESEQQKTLLNRMANVFLTVPDDRVYEEVLTLLLQTMKSRFGVFGFIAENGDLMIPTMTREIWNACQVPDKSMVFPAATWGNSLWGRALREQKLFCSQGPFHTPAGHIPIDNFLTTPILFAGQAIGLLSVANSARGYTAADQDLFKTIADYFSPILHARLERDRQEQRRQEAERGLRESEEKYRELFENAREAIVILDLDGTITDVNPFVEEYGFRRTDLIGRHHLEVVVASYREKAAQDWELLRQGILQEGEYEVLTPQGQVVVHYKDCPITRKGQVIRIQSTLTDITERRRAEEALRRSEAKYRQLHESLRDGFVVIDLNRRLVEFNAVYREMLGYSDEELHRLTCEDLTPSKWYDLEARIIREQVLTRGYSDIYEKEYRRKDGTIFPVELRAVLLRDPAQQPVGMWATVRDITERRRAEEALRESEARYRLLADNASDEIWTMDLNLRVTYCSPSVLRATGYTPEETLAMSLEERLTPASYQRVREILAQEMELERQGAGDPHRSRVLEMEERRKDGTVHWAEVRASFLRDALGRAMGIIGVTRDISERKRIEQQLLDHQNRLRELAAELTLAEERERRRIAVGVHDQIGQRLALTKLTVKSLQNATGEGDTSRALQGVCQEIDTVLEDVHSLTFELSNPILYEVGFEAAVESWLTQQIQDRHGLVCTFAADEEPAAWDKETRVVLFDIVREILANVVKHAQATHVDVRIRREAGSARISVQDDGVGFSPAPSGRSPTRPGVSVTKSGGFGLFNIREKLDYLGGSITIDPTPGKGTSVTVTVPWPAPELSEEKGEPL